MKKITQFFQKKKMPPFDPATLVVDVHSHIIPGIDDGASTLDESISMLRRLEKMGYKKVITTPHVMHDYYRNTPENIQQGLEVIRGAAQSENITLEIDAAAEYYCDEFFLELIQEGKLLTFGDRYVLFEFSFYTQPQIADQAIFEMQAKGYRPVLAHFERYPYFYDKREKWIHHFKDKGVFLQMNLLSLAGRYNKEIQKQAEWMVDQGFPDFVGTDSHHADHLDLISSSLHNGYFQKLKNLSLKNDELA